MSPEKETLTQYLEEISPGKHAVSQDSQDNVSTESIKSGDTGDIFGILREDARTLISQITSIHKTCSTLHLILEKTMI